MDVLKRTLLVAFYVIVVLAGIAGFLAIRSLRGDVRHGDARHGNAQPFHPDTVKVEQTVIRQ